jgi:hypothetical protein
VHPGIGRVGGNKQLFTAAAGIYMKNQGVLPGLVNLFYAPVQYPFFEFQAKTPHCKSVKGHNITCCCFYD